MKFAVAALLAALGAQQPAFRTAVDAVRVDVLVTRGARPVAGLTTANFELRDSGVVQKIDAFALEEVPLDLLLVLDTSLSVRGEPLQHLKDAAHAAVSTLRLNDRAGLITFSHIIQRRVPLASGAAPIHAAIDDVEADGSTAVVDAIYAALELPRGADRRVLVLVFTDGSDTASWLNPLTVIDSARRSDMVVEAVLFSKTDRVTEFRQRASGMRAAPAEMRRLFLREPQMFREAFLPVLAEDTGGEVVVASTSGDLRAAFANIVSSFKSRYVLTYTPTDVAATGWHPIDVRLKNGRGDVRARRGYMR